MNKKSILVVDDEEIIRYSLVNILRSHGYETTEVKSGKEALSVLYKRTYDLVLTDLVMESLDGLELVEQIKVISPRTVVVVLTGYGSIKTAISALRLGVYDYLLKPCDEDELLIRIRRALEMQNYGDEQKRFQESNAIAKTAVTLSDQINTPLNIILGNIEMLQLSQDFSDSSKAKKALATMERHIFKIKDVMEKLAKLTTTGTEKYTSLTDYEMIDLSGVGKDEEK
ncbi:MAG: response regulator [Thermodesulfobacteriota bacterium]|nr:response regulator [Thermodesulfobacteriota bacterium]